MKIGLIGYGKMGKEIEQIALQRGHSIAWKMNTQNMDSFTANELRSADVTIEFTSPHTVLENIRKCFAADIPVVVGSTGWYDHLEEIGQECVAGNRSVLYASNFSLGVNIFFAVNKKLASVMNHFPEYEVSLTEVHHTQKLDAPSGTAITLANGILENMERKKKWVNEPASGASELSIISERRDDVPGTHHVAYDSSVDRIELIHTAHNRRGFALGAVVAAEWLAGKKGFFSIGDMLAFD
jgi:4-hydroxy-tetrahydrodipicolinate reductase